MSLYHMVNGVNSSVVFFILPVLGRHPDEYPRFRDAFYGDENNAAAEGKLVVYTRTGGGNRPDYVLENDEIAAMDGFLFDYDDTFDSTYACWVFDIPERWKADVDKVLIGNLLDTRVEYQDMIISVYPKLEEKMREMFATSKNV